MVYKKILFILLLSSVVFSNNKAHIKLENSNKSDLKTIETVISNLSDQELSMIADFIENKGITPDSFPTKARVDEPLMDSLLVNAIVALASPAIGCIFLSWCITCFYCGLALTTSL